MSIEGILFDSRYAVRALRRRGSFTAIAVLTIALGIAASAEVSFSLFFAGICGGGVLAGFSTGVLSKYLFGVRPWDASTFAGVTVLLALTSLMAAYIPARRASRIDPAQCLRAE